MKLRAVGGGGSFRAGGGALGQQGAPPCYSSLWETLVLPSSLKHLQIQVFISASCMLTLKASITNLMQLMKKFVMHHNLLEFFGENIYNLHSM